jgi:hypothetical protein
MACLLFGPHVTSSTRRSTPAELLRELPISTAGSRRARSGFQIFHEQKRKQHSRLSRSRPWVLLSSTKHCMELIPIRARQCLLRVTITAALLTGLPAYHHLIFSPAMLHKTRDESTPSSPTHAYLRCLSRLSFILAPLNPLFANTERSFTKQRLRLCTTQGSDAVWTLSVGPPRLGVEKTRRPWAR